MSYLAGPRLRARRRLLSAALLTLGALGATLTAGCGDGVPSDDRSGRSPDSDGRTGVGLHEVQEVTLEAHRDFDAAGDPNPFTSVSLVADVESPSGRRYEVTGFFDGDGSGGAAGAIFSFRIAADELGPWGWTSRSDLASLDGRSGTFTVGPVRRETFRQGPVVPAPDHPSYLRFEEGEPVLLTGNFLDYESPEPDRYSHVFLSEALSEDDRERILRRHARDLGVNKMNIYLANRGDYGGEWPTTPWLGNADEPDRSRFDLARWHRYEAWISRVGESGLLAHLWFFADDSRFGDLSTRERRLLYRYAMARLSAHVNTAFTLMLEWDEGFSAVEVDADAEYVQEHNPWDRLLSVHGTSGDFAFPDAGWASFAQIQTGFRLNPDYHYGMTLRNRGRTDLPLINEEFAESRATDVVRKTTWSVAMAGAAGVGVGTGLDHLKVFFHEAAFETLSPSPSLVAEGDAYAMVSSGRDVLVLYVVEGGSVRVDLTEFASAYDVRWFDPRSGTWTDDDSLAGGGIESLHAPDGRDWAVLLTATDA